MARSRPEPSDYAFENGHQYSNSVTGGYGASDAKRGEKVSGSDAGLGVQVASADELLGILGYQSELVRSRSMFQTAFMSFVLASVPYGLSTTLYYPLAGGGPVAVIWGWCGVCVLMMCLAISLGEITSVYPTAGGVYYQSFMMAPRSSRRIIAWICGWAYTVGNICITLAVNFGTTLFIVACVSHSSLQYLCWGSQTSA
jgi:hypothetical protein